MKKIYICKKCGSITEDKIDSDLNKCPVCNNQTWYNFRLDFCSSEKREHYYEHFADIYYQI